MKQKIPYPCPKAVSLFVTCCAAACTLAATASWAQQAPLSQGAVGVRSTKPAQATFETAKAAVDALVQAVQKNTSGTIAAVLGPGADKVINSGDPQADASTRERFLAAHQQASYLEGDGDNRATLIVGAASWPFPFPLVKQGERWRFDTKRGLQQYLDRQIGGNELAVMTVLEAYVQAQREYAQRDRNRDGLLEYAQRTVSSEGQQDGLYWPVPAGTPPSPMGAQFALASLGRYRGTDESPQPVHGYYFRPLTSQGPSANGGAYDYVVKGHQIGGFAMIATPARHGVSGVMTFLVSHDGVVFSANLGKSTTAKAAQITRFDPGPLWLREDSR